MAADVFSIWVSVALMLGFCAFGQLMIEVKPQKCPWEKDQELVPDNKNFEARSRHDWKDYRPSYGAEDLHPAR